MIEQEKLNLDDYNIVIIITSSTTTPSTMIVTPVADNLYESYMRAVRNPNAGRMAHRPPWQKFMCDNHTEEWLQYELKSHGFNFRHVDYCNFIWNGEKYASDFPVTREILSEEDFYRLGVMVKKMISRDMPHTYYPLCTQCNPTLVHYAFTYGKHMGTPKNYVLIPETIKSKWRTPGEIKYGVRRLTNACWRRAERLGGNRNKILSTLVENGRLSGHRVEEWIIEADREETNRVVEEAKQEEEKRAKAEEQAREKESETIRIEAERAKEREKEESPTEMTLFNMAFFKPYKPRRR